jgi:hypothetical protein
MTQPPEKKPARRPFIGMHFTCCNVYTRIYLNKAGNAFVGWCPRCGKKKAEVRVSPSGGKSRFFNAD